MELLGTTSGTRRFTVCLDPFGRGVVGAIPLRSPKGAVAVHVRSRASGTLYMSRAFGIAFDNGVLFRGKGAIELKPFVGKVVTHPILPFDAVHIVGAICVTLGNGVLFRGKGIIELKPFVRKVVTHPVFPFL